MSDAGDDGPGQREVAYRLFATVYDDADLEHSESDEERAPNYVITPTGGRINRLFVVGVLTEVEAVSDDVLRGRVVDPTGAFVCYAGQYQPDERAVLDRTEPPAFVAVTGKARTFQPEDSERVFTSVRPESISQVDADARDRWTVDAAEATLHRVEAMATALALEASGEALRAALVDRGYDAGLAAGIDLAIDHYGTTPTSLAAVRDLALDAARLVAGDVEEVPELSLDPNAPGDVTPADLLEAPVEPLETDETAPTAATTDDPTERSEPAAPSRAEPETDAGTTAAAKSAGPETDTAEQSATDTGERAVDADESAAEGTSPATEAETSDDGGESTAEGPGDFEPGEFDLDEAEREEIESEYGTEFQSASEVDEPGAADIETPAPEEVETGDGPADERETEPADVEGAGVADATDRAADDPPDTEYTEPTETVSADESDDATDEGIEDVDLVAAVVSAMDELDEGDGADRSAVVESVVERHGADPDEVEDAIQDALMDGRCYEPDDVTLKPI